MKKKIRNMKVKQKLTMAFGLTIGGFAIAIVAAVILIVLMRGNMETFYQEPYVNSTLQMEIRKDLQAACKDELRAMTTDDMKQTQDYCNSAKTYIANIDANIAKLKANFSQTDLIAKLEDTYTKYKTEGDKVMQYAEKNENEAGLATYNSTYNAAVENLQNSLLDIGNQADRNAEGEYDTIVVLGIVAIVAMIALGIVSIGFSMYMSRILVKSLTAPIKDLENAAAKLSKGELNVNITYESEDEFGDLANNMKTACGFIDEVLADANDIMAAMADGNFNIGTKIEEKYVGDFIGLKEAMRKMNRTLNQTLKGIDEGVQQVTLGAEQMAENAVSLAEGATEQASAVEELTASIEDISNSSVEQAETSQKAYEDVSEATVNAEKSREDMAALTDAMSRINASSMEIENIIGSIEDIASQTSLLSLNASIEAARAGEAGRGFAVVADQIGKLAAESAQSAVSTRELIIKSLEEVRNGDNITQKTVAVLEGIIGSMSQFADIAKNASESSAAQSELLGQIKDGVEQISSVIQSNSAAAQESSATSEELSAQSESLKNLVDQFELRKD